MRPGSGERAGESRERTTVSDDPARVLLIDGQTVFREALAVALEREPDIVVIGLAGSITEARACLTRTPADVAVMERDLPDGDGLDVIRDLRHARPLVQVLVLTASSDRFSLAQAVAAGAAGALPKTAPLVQLVTAVRRLCAGHPLLDPAELVRALHLSAQHRSEREGAARAVSRLTPREREILAALAQGLSDKEIAQHLGIGHETVRSHMVHLLGKLGVESRLQALVFALKHGVVRLEQAP